jgi:HEAT repeat protein
MEIQYPAVSCQPPVVNKAEPPLSEASEESLENEPPARRFLVSFVIIPGAIVLVCLSILVGIRWLTFSGTTPDQLVDTIERREGNVRWRAAVQLAGVLADPELSSLRRDRRLAARLTAILRRELESGGARKEDVMLRIFLCRALGEFELEDSLSVLIDAADEARHRDVRRSAIEAIALLGDMLGRGRVWSEIGMKDALMAASRDGDPQVRLSATYALGVLGGQSAEQRLGSLLLDENVLVRYNAATGLARWGDPAAVDVLLEMLKPDQQVAGQAQEAQRQLIHINALEATGQLMKANSEIPGQEFREAVDQLEKASESQAVRAKINVVRDVIEGRKS